jgi:hypothetical protein
VTYGPAASYRCLIGKTDCRYCYPDPVPCDEFKGPTDDEWCAECGWAVWAHEN